MAIIKELKVRPTLAADSCSQMPARPLSPREAEKVAPSERKPAWFKIKPPGGENYLKIKSLLREKGLHTVCEEAHCPNVSECWSDGTATLMLGSDTCTRACRFCAVKTAKNPPPLDPDEPQKVAKAVAEMGLRYVVLTSVDRDDLEDLGSRHFAHTISALKTAQPSLIVEALVPDFQGQEEAVSIVVHSGVDVFAHNLETVQRLHKRVRDVRAKYETSLGVLKAAKRLAQGREVQLYTKSSLMVGLGETHEEIRAALEDLRAYDVDVVTFGQYLRPSLKHLPVERFYSPEEFASLQEMAERMGFLYVASGPLVRSSYKAGEFFIRGVIEKARKQHGI